MSIDVRSLLFGKDNTPRIVSVKPGLDGKALIWRRINNKIFCQEKKLRNWLILSEAAISLLNGFDKRKYDLIEFEGSHPFKYGVMTYRYRELRDHIIKNYNQGNQVLSASGLNDIPSVLSFPAMEQFLIGSGMTCFKEMNYDDLLRLQFDLETYGLNPKEAAIFLIVVSDSSGYKRILHDREMSEAEMILELYRIIKERDPDVLENHNIFGFDIPFLIERASLYGIHPDIGRDGSGFMSHRAMLKVGAATEPFTKHALSGREIIDTLQAVKRYNAFARTMKSHDLKYSSQYFGVQAKEREYIDGIDIGNLWKSDSQRVIKYAGDDVEEVNNLSRLLMGPAFALSQMVPTNYDKVAHSGTASLIDLILNRGYLMHRHSLPEPSQGEEHIPGAETKVLVRGVVQSVVKADIESLYPSIMLEYNIKPKSDTLNIFLPILKQLKELRVYHKSQILKCDPSSQRAQREYHNAMQGALKVLINSFYGYLGTGFARFNDLQAAGEVTNKGREILRQLCDEIVKRGGKLIEIDTDGAYFTPPSQLKDISQHEAFVEKLSASLGEGLKVSYDGSWKSMYSYTMKNYALLDSEDKLKIMGVAFKSSQREEIFTEFLEKALELLLKGDLVGLRKEYLSLIKQLKSHQLPVKKLLRTTRLSKSLDDYQRNRRSKQSYYDLLISANINAQVGDIVSYYNCGKNKNDNSWKLAAEYKNDYNVDFYLEQLKSVIDTLKFAFSSEDFLSLFAPDDQLFLLNTPIEKIKTLAAEVDERGEGIGNRE